MLVLSRQIDEVIIIQVGSEIIEIEVTDIRSDKVRLGITAPRHIQVHRKEVYERIYGNTALSSNEERNDNDSTSASGDQKF